MGLFRQITHLFVSERGQLVFAIILLILIPAVLVFNTFTAINNAKENMDIELRRKALLAEKVFQATTKNIIDDQEKLQKVIVELVKSSEEVRGIDILVPEGENFTIFASLDSRSIGVKTSALNNHIAWLEEETIAFQTKSPEILTINQRLNPFDVDQRFWIVVSPLYNEAGVKTALLSMKFSSKIIDDLVQSSITNAIIILVITIIIIVLLLASNTKLFQYTMLFRKLKDIDRMKDEFISIASHELRTPITGIKGYLEMTLDGTMGEIPDKAKEALVLVNKAAERLGVLVEDLLNVSRIEQGRLKMEFSIVNVLPIIKEVIAELKSIADDKKLELKYKGPEELPLISVSKDHFKQVLINLIGNGLKYTQEGEVTIHTEVKENNLRIKVADTGIGLSSTERERLFTKFFRVQNEKTKDISGTGLGLWITKQLVELMKGKIEVQSIEGVGSQFILVFDIKKSK